MIKNAFLEYLKIFTLNTFSFYKTIDKMTK